SPPVPSAPASSMNERLFPHSSPPAPSPKRRGGASPSAPPLRFGERAGGRGSARWAKLSCLNQGFCYATVPPASGPAGSVVSHVTPPRSAVRFPRLPRQAGTPVGLDGGAGALRGRVRRPRVPRPLLRARLPAHPDPRRTVVSGLGDVLAQRAALADPRSQGL